MIKFRYLKDYDIETELPHSGLTAKDMHETLQDYCDELRANGWHYRDIRKFFAEALPCHLHGDKIDRKEELNS